LVRRFLNTLPLDLAMGEPLWAFGILAQHDWQTEPIQCQSPAAR
jgi:hypothetical protein